MISLVLFEAPLLFQRITFPEFFLQESLAALGAV